MHCRAVPNAFEAQVLCAKRADPGLAGYAPLLLCVSNSALKMGLSGDRGNSDSLTANATDLVSLAGRRLFVSRYAAVRAALGIKAGHQKLWEDVYPAVEKGYLERRPLAILAAYVHVSPVVFDQDLGHL